MVAEILVDRNIEDGRVLLQHLDMLMPIDGAFWLKDAESRRWELILSSPLINTRGPISIYKTVQQAIKQLDNRIHLALSDIRAVSPDSNERQYARVVAGLGSSPIHVRFRNGTIEDVSTDEIYIYRLTEPSVERKSR